MANRKIPEALKVRQLPISVTLQTYRDYKALPLQGRKEVQRQAKRLVALAIRRQAEIEANIEKSQKSQAYQKAMSNLQKLIDQVGD